MKLPHELLDSLEGIKGFEKEAFIAVHESGTDITSVRLNEAKQSATGSSKDANNNIELPITRSSLPIASSVPWCSSGYYLSQRPSFTFDPLFHAGCYYVQEASSMFLEQACKQLLDLSQPLKVLDLCAAPGGKSTHIDSLISPESLLVSNEVIKQRCLVLNDNISKWGCSNVIVTNNDPKAFQKLPGYFDVMVVDAPCSGSGLFRKDAEAVDEWSLNNVQLCSQRQQRILADALPALKEGGLLIYSTCSYSTGEDETIADWLVKEMGLESLPLQTESFNGIVETGSPQSDASGYRFYPDKLKGEGFFLSCFQKHQTESGHKLRAAKPEAISVKEKRIVSEWITGDDFEFLRFRDSIFAVPQNILQDFLTLQSLLNLQYAGVQMGEVMKEKLVPHHALAQSRFIKTSVPAVDLSYEQAIRYLQRQALSIEPESLGWQVVQHQGQNLGWINALKTRVNNYYPKELRILKQHNNTAFEK